MTPEELDRIYSNEYADFIVQYNGDFSLLEKYKGATVQIINFFLAVVRLPVSVMTENVVSQMGYSLLPSLFGLVSETSMEASGIDKLRSIPRYDLRGKGVIIGMVDSGIDYTNPVFQYADKTTRIAGIWDQTIVSEDTLSSGLYGTQYSREQINEALKSEDPFHIVPSRDEIGHGTMIAGIAAGNEVPESGFFGVASEAELVVVKLKPAKAYLKNFFRIPPNAVIYQENDLITGIQYLADFATKRNQPIVICLACDTPQYAHDGRGTTSSWISLMANLVGIAIVLPVGNEGSARRHFLGEITQVQGYDTMELNVGPNETGFSMEIWGASPNIFTIDILSPSGEYIPRMINRLNETKKVTFIFESTVIYIDYQMVESQSGDQLILLRFSNPAPGIWKFNVYGRGVSPMNFNSWLPMNDFITTDTYFIRSNPNITLLSVSCSSIPISVTAYNTEDDSLYLKAGKGYTRIGMVKPDLAAPGVDLMAPTLNHTFYKVTGTSASAAHTAGVAAMFLEWGIINGYYPQMNTLDIKIFMIRGAKRKEGMSFPNQEWGYGILDIYSTFDRIRSQE